MRSGFSILQLFCSFLFAVTASATLLFRPSTADRPEKRLLADSQTATEMTNAERFALGLPPSPPTSRTRTARQSEVSPDPGRGGGGRRRTYANMGNRKPKDS
ncbi:hypothetical protein FRB90_010215, partial [Tulasnella sp. 427]